MILRCPRCHRKNRLPDDLVLNGEYLCRNCGQILFGATAEDRPGAPPPPRPTARPTAPAPRAAGRFNDAELRRSLRALKLPRALVLLNAAYVLVLLALAVSNALGPEQWWGSSLNLYLPQWLWALPGVLLLPLTLRADRKLAVVPLLALLWVFGPLMGFGLHWPASPDASDTGGGTGTRLRVMTYNVKWGERDAAAIVADIRAFHPDLVQFQDSEGVMDGGIGRALDGWNVRRSGQYLVASHLPLPGLEVRDFSFAGSDHHCVRYLLHLGAADVAVYDVHLLSPRGGLEAIRHRDIAGLAGNTGDRLEEAARLTAYVRSEPGPTIVTGDLNAPVQSLVCRRLFDAGLRDAFSEAGSGYGYSYGAFTGVRVPYVRIDHVLVSHQWQVRHCWVGNAKGSDHRPVIADLVLAP